MILAFTGAGISRDSGISTFMERPDIRDKLYRSYAMKHPNEYNTTIKALYQIIQLAEPNDAHYALSDYDVDVITMNIDNLHEKAGSTPINLHGTMPSEAELYQAHQLYNKPVLYGDPAPNYQAGMEKVNELKEGDILLVIGASMHTAIAVHLRDIASRNGAEIIEIQANAKKEVRRTLEKLSLEGRL